MNPWLKHVEKWQNCKACRLCQSRQKVVLARGDLPCDVLFVGEAPGESEDCLGVPFVGPAGQLLDWIISQALRLADQAHGYSILRKAFTNLVCCIPRDEEGGKASEPDHDAIQACSGRLSEFIGLASPKLLVAVGKLAKEYIEPGYKHSVKRSSKIPFIEIHHPAYILRASQAQQGLLAQRCIVKLKNAVEEL